MKIAVISHQIYPCNIGGLELFNHYFIKELASQEYTIWVFTYCDYDWNDQNIYRVKLWKGFPGIVILSTYFSIIYNLIKLRNKINLIKIPYTSNEILAFPILFINKLLNIPYVIVIHGGGLLEWKLKMLHQSFFKHADTIVAVSENIGKEYEKRSGRKIKVIPPLLPFTETQITKNELKNKFGFDNKDVIILSLGTIKKIKGSDILLEAFLNLGRKYVKINNLKLIYVGGGSLKDELERNVAGKNLSQYVKFFGPISHEKVNEMYKLADIYVIPSFFEGMPISLLEAMFNGLSIVGTNTNGINNLIIHRKNGLLFKKGNINDLKNKIKELVDDKNLAKRLGNSAKNTYTKEYTFQYMISEYEKIFKETLK